MDLLKKIDEILYKFSNNLGIKNAQEGQKFIYEIFFLFAFFFVLFTGNKKMILLCFIMFLFSIYDLRKYFKN